MFTLASQRKSDVGILEVHGLFLKAKEVIYKCGYFLCEAASYVKLNTGSIHAVQIRKQFTALIIKQNKTNKNILHRNPHYSI